MIWLKQHGRRSGLLDNGADVRATRNEQGQTTEFSHLIKMSDLFFPLFNYFFFIPPSFSSHSIAPWLISEVLVGIVGLLSLPV